MNYRIDLAREAEKVLDRIDSATERRVRARMMQLAHNPFDPRLSTQLTERAGIRRSRVGGWRILFDVKVQERLPTVLVIDTRGQVYKH